MKKMGREQQKAVGASMAESGINMNAQQMVAQQAQQIDPMTGLPVEQMINVPPALSNTLGQAQPVFNQQTQQNAQGIFGGIDQRQNSVGAPLMFEDQTGDGIITQADVIKARTEGYKK